MAAKELLIHTIAELERQFKREMPKEGKRRIWPDLLKEPDKALEATYDYYLLHSAYLPSPAQFLAKVQEEGRKLRMAEAKQREEDHDRQKPKRTEDTFLTREQQTEYGKRCLQIFYAAMPLNESGMPRQHAREELEAIVAACEAMERNYPNSADEWHSTKMMFIKKGQAYTDRKTEASN